MRPFLSLNEPQSGTQTLNRVIRAHRQFPEPLLDIAVDVVAFLVSNLDEFPVDLGDYFENSRYGTQRIACPDYCENCREGR